MIIYRQKSDFGIMETWWGIRNKYYRESVALGILLDRLEHCFKYEWRT